LLAKMHLGRCVSRGEDAPAAATERAVPGVWSFVRRHQISTDSRSLYKSLDQLNFLGLICILLSPPVWVQHARNCKSPCRKTHSKRLVPAL
jgi:hypothetical protein